MVSRIQSVIRPTELEYLAEEAWNAAVLGRENNHLQYVATMMQACAQLWALHPKQDRTVLDHLRVTPKASSAASCCQHDDCHLQRHSWSLRH